MFDLIKTLLGLTNCRRCKFRRMWGLYCGFKCKRSLHLKSSAWKQYGCWYYVDKDDGGAK